MSSGIACRPTVARDYMQAEEILKRVLLKTRNSMDLDDYTCMDQDIRVGKITIHIHVEHSNQLLDVECRPLPQTVGVNHYFKTSNFAYVQHNYANTQDKKLSLCIYDYFYDAVMGQVQMYMQA